MKKSRPRTTRELSASLVHQLNMYALAASAAGVAVLALAQPAEAKVVYTKAHKWLAPNSNFPLDLNHDGIVDFKLDRYSYIHYRIDRREDLFVSDARGNGVGAIQTSVSYATLAFALSAGRTVSAGLGFGGGGFMAGQDLWPSSFSCSFAYWAHAKNRYLGFQFSIRGAVHYGWARLSVNSCNVNGLKALLTGYAYETVANKPIITGRTNGPDVITVEPATLGHLARGSSAVSAWGGRRPTKREPR